MKLVTTLLLALAAFCRAADPLKDAILLKGIDDLKEIAEKAGLDYEDDAKLEELQARCPPAARAWSYPEPSPCALAEAHL